MSLHINNSQVSGLQIQPGEKKHLHHIIGKLFGRQEADHLFGPVFQTVPMPTDQLIKHLLLTKDRLLFKIKGEEIHLLTNKRVPITHVGSVIPRAEVYKVCSLTVLNDLLQFGKEEVTLFEKRENTLTITNGMYTLEMVSNCPPFCE